MKSYEFTFRIAFNWMAAADDKDDAKAVIATNYDGVSFVQRARTHEERFVITAKNFIEATRQAQRYCDNQAYSADDKYKHVEIIGAQYLGEAMETKD